MFLDHHALSWNRCNGANLRRKDDRTLSNEQLSAFNWHRSDPDLKQVVLAHPVRWRAEEKILPLLVHADFCLAVQLAAQSRETTA